jgi:DNA-binding transcriptional LysR family regulator
VRLTQAGETLQRTVGEIDGCWLRFESSMAEIRGLVRGRLRIAAVTTAEYFVPDLVGPFDAEHPGVEIQLAVENRDRVVERLYRGEDDLAVMMLPPADVPLESARILDNPLVVIAPAAHPLAGRKARLAQLADERWLMREAGSGTRLVAEQHFAEAGFTPRIAMSLGSNEAIKHAVAAGLGVAVVSRLAVESSVPARRRGGAGLVILDVARFPIRRHWSVVWRRDQLQTLAARRFVQYLEQERRLPG